MTQLRPTVKITARRIGLISDTHGLLRSQAVAALAGSEAIIHAGDVGSPLVLDGLREIAPVIAIRGNVDRDGWARRLPPTEAVEIGTVIVYVLHDVGTLDFDPAEAGFQVVIYGHSHRPLIERRGSVLYVNPGSAGPRRFSLPITVGSLTVSGSDVDCRVIHVPS